MLRLPIESRRKYIKSKKSRERGNKHIRKKIRKKKKRKCQIDLLEHNPIVNLQGEALIVRRPSSVPTASGTSFAAAQNALLAAAKAARKFPHPSSSAAVLRTLPALSPPALA